MDLSATIDRDAKIKLVTSKDPEALEILRHSAAHVMAQAVLRLYDTAKLTIGPVIEDGFYYDIDMDPISEDDFTKIEAEMKKIIKENEPFERFEEPRGRALEICRDLHQDLKVEHIDTGLADQETVSFYRQGEFVDLCRGPHIPDAGKIKPIDRRCSSLRSV